MKEANTEKKLTNIKLDQIENLLPIHIFNLPTATKNPLKKSVATEGDRQKFQKDIITLLKLLIEMKNLKIKFHSFTLFLVVKVSVPTIHC